MAPATTPSPGAPAPTRRVGGGGGLAPPRRPRAPRRPPGGEGGAPSASPPARATLPPPRAAPTAPSRAGGGSGPGDGPDTMIGGVGFDIFRNAGSNDFADSHSHPTFTAEFDGSQLTISGDQDATRLDDRIRVRQSGGSIFVTDLRTSTPVLITQPGGDQTDSVAASSVTAGILVTGGEGNDLIDVSGGGVAPVTVRSTLQGGNGNDSLTGGTGNDLIEGGAGADRLNGGNGDDMIFGFTSATPNASDLNNTINGGYGND